MKITNLELDKMRNIDIRTVDRNTLKDIRDVVIDTNLSHEERIENFVEQTHNPFIFKCGELVVKTNFSTETDATLDDKLTNYLASM